MVVMPVSNGSKDVGVREVRVPGRQGTALPRERTARTEKASRRTVALGERARWARARGARGTPPGTPSVPSAPSSSVPPSSAPPSFVPHSSVGSSPEVLF